MEELLHITSESLSRFLTRWYGDPDRPIFANPEAAKLPPPLSVWHEIASQWSTPVTTLNHPLDPSELEIEDGKLVFWVENHGCWTWSANINGEDPMVFDRQPGSDPEPWATTDETLSDFLLHATVFEAIVGAPCQIYVKNITEEVLSQIASELRPLPLPHWRWPSSDVRILVGTGLLAQVSDSMESGTIHRFDVTIAAPSSGALAPLSNLAGVPWKSHTPVERQESNWDDLPNFLR